MTTSPQPLPDFWPAEDLAAYGILPLGDEAMMRALFAEALPLIEVYDAPWGRPATRLSLHAVRRRGWSVIPGFLEAPEDGEEALVAAVQARAAQGLAGCVMAGPAPRPSIVWQVPATVEGMRKFWQSHKGMETLLLPRDHGFALFGEGEQLRILAGPSDFLRAAVPDPAAMHRAITTHAAEMDRINGHTDASDLLRYYAPVTIDH